MKRGSTASIVLLMLGLFLTFGLLAGGTALLSRTFIPKWIPITIATVPAIVTAPVLMNRWQKLTHFSRAWLNIPCHILLVGTVLYFGFLAANYWGGDDSTLHPESSTVIAKHRKQHTRYRRAGRRTQVPAGHYYTYHLKLELPDGHVIDQPVSLQKYNRTRKGAHYTVKLEKGLFGYTVVK